MGEVTNPGQAAASRGAGRPSVLERAVEEPSIRKAGADADDAVRCPSCGAVIFPPIMLIPEAAAYLRCSEGQLRKMLNSGVVPASKIDWRWRIRRADLDAVFERNKRPLRP